MNFIGNIIKEYRLKSGISRKKLSEHICSEKYVYLIEKGERTPSSGMTRLFGDKLGVDLFEYDEYLDCINPIDVYGTIKSFNKYRRENDLIALKKVTEDAIALPDFHSEPWAYEIELNRISYMILKEGRYIEGIKNIYKFIHKINPMYSKSICMANFYVLLSTCYQMARDLDNAKNAVLLAYEIVRDKQNITKYAQAVISVKINKITMHYLSGELDEVIHEGLLLCQYQIQMNSYERVHHTFFYLAYAYYEKGLEDEGISWFVKSLYIANLRYKPMDIHYLSSYKMFEVLFNDHRISVDLINEYKSKYKIN